MEGLVPSYELWSWFHNLESFRILGRVKRKIFVGHKIPLVSLFKGSTALFKWIYNPLKWKNFISRFKAFEKYWCIKGLSDNAKVTKCQYWLEARSNWFSVRSFLINSSFVITRPHRDFAVNNFTFQMIICY